MSNGLTIGQLAELCNLSRSTLLYYDRLGLLRPLKRTGANYRLYSSSEVERLKQICFYRKMGLSLREMARLLQQTKESGTAAAILQRRLEALEREIELRQEQQRQIVRLLEQFPKSYRKRSKRSSRKGAATTGGTNKSNSIYMEAGMVNKKRWIEIMLSAGITEEAAQSWHKSFEKLEPDAHQEFLESLGIEAEEVTKIREFSRA